MIKGLKEFIKDKNIRRKLSISILMIFTYHILSVTPIPIKMNDIPADVSSLLASTNFLSIAYTGNGFMALGYPSYMVASVLIQFLITFSRKFKNRIKQPGGDLLKKRIIRFTSATLAFVMSTAIYYYTQSKYPLFDGASDFKMVIAIIFNVFGALFTAVIIETIDEQGYGQGSSILILTNIIKSLPTVLEPAFNNWLYLSEEVPFKAAVVVLVLITVIIVMVLMETSSINIKYKSGVARYRGVENNEFRLPFKINILGIMPLLMTTLVVGVFIRLVEAGATLIPAFKKFYDWTIIAFQGSDIRVSIVMALIITILYVILSFVFIDREEVSLSFIKNSAVIEGVMPGKPTKSLINGVITGISLSAGLIVGLMFIVMNLFMFNIGISTNEISSFMILVSTSTMLLSEIALDVKIRSY